MELSDLFYMQSVYISGFYLLVEYENPIHEVSIYLASSFLPPRQEHHYNAVALQFLLIQI